MPGGHLLGRFQSNAVEALIVDEVRRVSGSLLRFAQSISDPRDTRSIRPQDLKASRSFQKSSLNAVSRRSDAGPDGSLSRTRKAQPAGSDHGSTRGCLGGAHTNRPVLRKSSGGWMG